MNSKYFIFVLLVMVSCKESEKTEKNASIQRNDSIAADKKIDIGNEEKRNKSNKIIEIGYQEKLDKLPHFKLDSISEVEYNSISSNKSFKEYKIESNKDFFYIEGAHKKFEFKKYRDYKGAESWSGFEYLGYCGSLRLAAIREFSTADNLGFSELQLLDTSSDFQYKIISLGDSSVSVPELSPDGRCMVYVQNPEYESEGLSIVVLKVNGKTDPYRFLIEYKSCFSESAGFVEEIKWESDRVFCMKISKSAGFDENGYQIKYYSYCKAEI